MLISARVLLPFSAAIRAPELRLSASAAAAPLDRALLAARACSCAFLPTYAITSSPYAGELRCVAQVEDPDTLAGATIFTTADEVIIACRGSASLRNFKTNFAIGPVPLETPSGKHPTARVHEGFQKAAQALWQRCRPRLPATGQVLVTGHSLGGGTAHFLSLYAQEAGRESSLLTVAGPRLGNAAFRDYFRERCPDATHLIHSDDDVIKSNAQLWDGLGFEHVGQVVRCDKDAPRLYAEPGCVLTDKLDPSKVSLQGVLVDHCNYLGIYIGVRANHPSVWFRRP